MAAVLAGGFYENESGRRLLLWAVAGSLGLHFMLFVLVPLLMEAYPARAVPPLLKARLAMAKPPEPAPPKIAPPPLPAPVARVRPQPAPAIVPREQVARVDRAKQPAAAAPVVPAPAAPAAAVAAAQPASAPQPGSPAAGPDPGSVARYRLELMDLARRYKRYPRIAQDNGWEGRVELRIAIGEDGALASLVVKKSAGRAPLDDEAQAMIRAAKAEATLPSGLRGKAFALEIPVDFYLKDETR
jgi:periplasmic protein TonB